MQNEEQKEIKDIKKIIADFVLELRDIKEIDYKSNLVRELSLDSLDLVFLATSIEETYGITIEDWEIANSAYFKSIESISGFVFDKMTKAGDTHE